MAFSTGMLRVNETGMLEKPSMPRSAPTNRTHLTLDSNPAFVNTDESETPAQLAVLTPPELKPFPAHSMVVIRSRTGLAKISA
jgi:hypothetical protein